MRIIIIGPSDFDDADKVSRTLAKLTKPGDVLRLKGRMKGAARLAQDWATSGPQSNWRKVEVFYLEDGKQKANAEMERERIMFDGEGKWEKAHALICFGEPGRMVSQAKERRLKVKVVK